MIQHRQADDELGPLLPRLLGQRLQQGLAHPVEKFRDGRLRPDDDIVAEGLAGQLHIGAQGGKEGLLVPLEGLGNVGLEHGGADGRALGLGPFQARQTQAGEPDEGEREGDAQAGAAPPDRQAPEQARGQGDQQADPMDAEEGDKTRQGAIHLGVAGIEPGKPGQEPAPQPFQQDPEGGKGQEGTGPVANSWLGPGLTPGWDRARAAQPGRQPTEEAMVEGHGQDEEQGQGMGQPGPHVAKLVQADADPEDTKTQQADTKGPADEQALLGPPAHQQAQKHRQGDHQRRGKAKGREGQHGQGPSPGGQEGRQRGAEMTGPGVRELGGFQGWVTWGSSARSPTGSKSRDAELIQ